MSSVELVCRADDPRWLAERLKGVTATDIPAILGLSQYDSLYACYWRKVGAYTDPRESARLRLGRALESHIVELWQESTGQQLGRVSALYRSADRSWQLATPDRRTLIMPSGGGEPLECKSWGSTAEWGPDGSDVIPVQVRAQVLWQMDTLGSAVGHVGVVFLPSGEFRSYRLAHDHIEWQDPATGLMSGIGALGCQVCTDQETMRKAGAEFWRRVTELDAPTPDGSAASLAMLKARFGNPAKQETAEIDRNLKIGWQQAKTAARAYEDQARSYEAKIREQAGDAGLYAVNGEVFARRERFTAHVRAHDRTTDRLMPVKPREDKNDEQ